MFSTKSAEIGEAHEAVSVESCDGEERIGIDGRLLIQTLTHIESEFVVIEFIAPDKTVIFKPKDDESHVCLLHPMRISTD